MHLLHMPLVQSFSFAIELIFRYVPSFDLHCSDEFEGKFSSNLMHLKKASLE